MWHRTVGAAVLLVVVLAGCSSVPTDPGLASAQETAGMGDPDNSEWQFGYEAGVSLATDPEYASAAVVAREAELSCAELAEQIHGITEDGVQLWSGCVSGWLDSQ